jgi:uncharacterized protein YdiU (UPF0061 family)
MSKLNFDNSYARLPSHWYQSVSVTPLKNTHLISFNAPLAQSLGLNPCEWAPSQLVDTFTTEQGPEGAEPLAMKYTGHQFGVYNPDLGDGRGILLGEHLDPKGNRWDFHLKGAGKTAYSRFADGKAVLRSSIREYLVSEAMFGLGIPTTRALAIFGSEEFTLRNGAEPCAQVLRVTPCHIRFGHFEYFYYSGQHEDLKQLADYVIDRYYPDAKQAENPYLFMYQQVVERSAYLVAQWQSYGFVHAVMNTDNMSIIGETFDYGPFTFMDRYEPDHIANKNDDRGRYAFSNQPSIMQWNLAALAQALIPLIDKSDLEAQLDRFSTLYFDAYYTKLSQRLALPNPGVIHKALIDEMLALLEKQQGDLNRFILALTDLEKGDALGAEEDSPESYSEWLSRFYAVRHSEEEQLKSRLDYAKTLNPVYILRNYMCEEAIRDAHEGDYQRVNHLLAMVREPTKYYAPLADYADAPPKWAEGIFLTCSS